VLVGADLALGAAAFLVVAALGAISNDDLLAKCGIGKKSVNWKHSEYRKCGNINLRRERARGRRG
jgi:hypothetical protein